MPLNRNTLMRIRTIDACLQRRSRKWTLEDLRKACEEALYEYEGIESISLRTTQRDIELMRGDKFGYFAPIVVREKKYYEYEDPEFSIMNLPLSEKDIAELTKALDIFRHYKCFRGMGGQEDILARLHDRIQQQESDRKLIYLDTNEQLKGLDFLGILYEHILKKEPITVDYKSFKRKEQTLELSPYLLKEYNNRWFLFGYNHNKNDIRTCALDRIMSVRKNGAEKFIENTFFNPDELFGSMVGVTKGTMMEIDLKVEAKIAPYILTKPIHASQTLLSAAPDGSVILRLNLIHNLELERIILSYADLFEVLSPPLLRDRIARQLTDAAAKYQSSTQGSRSPRAEPR